MGIDFAYRKIEFPEREKRVYWSYGGFNAFRERLAKEIGIDLRLMDGFCGPDKEGVLWGTVNDYIVPFLNHSDCDGNLSPDQCRDIYIRLIELVQHWPDDDYDKRTALKLADMMEQCAKNEWVLEFR